MERNITHLVLAAGLVLGICADALFGGCAPGISVPLFVAGGLALLAALARHAGITPARGDRWLALLALLFATLTAMIAEPTLRMLNMLTSLGLLTLLVAGFGRGAVARWLPLEWLGQSITVAATALMQPFVLAAASAAALVPRGPGLRALAPVAVGLLIAAPIVGTFTLLLAMADGAFATLLGRVLTLDLPGGLLQHGMTILAASWLCAGGLGVAIANGNTARGIASGRVTERLRGSHVAPLDWTTGVTVIVCVDLLFLLFSLVQIQYLFGGQAALDASGMTYADYARRGFFELTLVALLVLLLLRTLAHFTRREGGRAQGAFLLAAGLLALLTLGLVASAYLRMQLYQAAYGFTQLRIFTQWFMAWIAVALVLCMLAIQRGRARIFGHGSAVVGMVLLAVLSLSNPEATIVREIARRGVVTEDYLTIELLESLSSDAYGAIRAASVGCAGRGDVLRTADDCPYDEPTRAFFAELLIRQQEQIAAADAGGWPSWHLSRALAGWR